MERARTFDRLVRIEVIDMLDPWIIEEIRKREEKRDQDFERVELPLELPLQRDGDAPASPEPDKDKHDRGVVIIDL